VTKHPQQSKRDLPQTLLPQLAVNWQSCSTEACSLEVLMTLSFLPLVAREHLTTSALSSLRNSLRGHKTCSTGAEPSTLPAIATREHCVIRVRSVLPTRTQSCSPFCSPADKRSASGWDTVEAFCR
jgi:hypothetical protein